MSEPARPERDEAQVDDAQGLASREYMMAVGQVTVGSSSLDHALRLLHAASTVDRPSDPPVDADPWGLVDMRTPHDRLERETRRAWRRWLEAGALSGEEVRSGRDWTREALTLLERRDQVVHALWRVDPLAPEGVHGRHVRTDHLVPRLTEMQDLSALIRDHLADERLVLVWTGIARARQSADS